MPSDADVEEAALARMKLALGDRVKVGDATVELRGILLREPDRGLNAFASLGPRLMLPLAAMADSGLVQAGSLLTWHYRLRLPNGVSDKSVVEILQNRFPNTGLRVQGLEDAGGGIRFWLNRLTQFISLIGLASLLVAGVLLLGFTAAPWLPVAAACGWIVLSMGWVYVATRVPRLTPA